MEAFDGDALPSGWIAHHGNWSMTTGSGGHARVLQGTGQAEPGLSSLVDHKDGVFAVFTLEVDFLMVSGEHPQGAGLVFDWKDENNYQIVRYSISEQGWHLFTVVNGNRNKQSDTTLANTTNPQFNQWLHLRVVQSSGRVTAYDNATKVLEYTLKPGDSASGFVGVFCRGDTKALFDDLQVRPSGA